MHVYMCMLYDCYFLGLSLAFLGEDGLAILLIKCIYHVLVHTAWCFVFSILEC